MNEWSFNCYAMLLYLMIALLPKFGIATQD